MSSVRKGKSAELAVASELLRRDLDVFIPLADTGVDLICLIGEKPNLIQVKESRAYDHDEFKRYWFHPERSKLIDDAESGMTYVFVLRGELLHYAVIPAVYLVNNLNRLDESKGRIHIYIDMYDGKVVEGRKGELDLSGFLDNFAF